jgi:uncharacterized protein YggE
MNSLSDTFKWQPVGLTVLAVAVLILAIPIARGRDAPQTSRLGGITVTGHSQTLIDPDTAYVSLGVVTRDKSSRKAVNDNAHTSQAIMNAIRSLGIKDKDIQTINYSVQPWVKYTKYGEKYLGFVVHNTVRVTVRDIKKISDVTDAGTNAGANSMQGISFGVNDDEACRRDALASAVGNAKKKAEAVAKKLGVNVGRPLSVKESGTDDDYAPVLQMRVARMRVHSSATPISPGQLEITQDVEVTFAISPH